MFDQNHGLTQPFTAKDNQYSIANLHQNNSNDVFMFPFQSQSHLWRAEHRKLGLTVFNSFFCIEGKICVELNTQSLEISEKLLPTIQNLFCLLFDVYLPRGVCSSRSLLQVPWASQVMNFL